MTGLGGDGASAMRRRPRAGGGGAEPVPLEGGLGERPGLAAAVVGRLVEPGVERGRPSACPTAKPVAARPTAFSTVLPPRASRDDLQAEALGRTACRARRPASRHRRSRHGAERRVGGHWSRLRGQSVSLPPRRTVGPAQDAHLAPSQLRHEEGPGDSHVEAATLSGDPI